MHVEALGLILAILLLPYSLRQGLSLKLGAGWYGQSH